MVVSVRLSIERSIVIDSERPSRYVNVKKVVYVSGTRADYGLMVPTLQAINKSRTLDLEIIATGMHIMPEFGMTVDEIKNDGFKPHVVSAIYKHDTKESMALFAG